MGPHPQAEACAHARPNLWAVLHLRAVQLITAPAGPVVLAPDLVVGGTT